MFHDAHAQRGSSPSQLYFLQRQHYEIVPESTIMGVSYIHVVSIMEMYIVQRQPIALRSNSWSGFTVLYQFSSKDRFPEVGLPAFLYVLTAI